MKQKIFIKLVLVLISCLFLPNNLYAQGNTPLPKFIYVDAEGAGVTKDEALNAAFTEAVRKAVGAYLVSNTTITSDNISDEIKEQIIVHSRGIISSYVEVYSENKNNIWTIYIKAEIENQLMQESVGSIMQIFFKPTDNAIFEAASRWQQRQENEQKQLDAKRYTEEQKKKSANDLLELFMKEFSLNNVVKLDTTEVVIDEQTGKMNVLVSYSYNEDIHREIFNNKFKNLLRVISNASQEFYFPNEAIERNRDGGKGLKVSGTLFYRSDYTQSYPNPYKNIYITEDFSKYTVFSLNKDLYEKLENFYKNYLKITVILDVQAFDKNNNLIDKNVKSETYNYNVLEISDVIYIKPYEIFKVHDNINYKTINTSLPLDISAEDIQTKYSHHAVDLVITFAN